MVSYMVDSLFGLDENSISASVFNMDGYTVDNLQNRNLIGVGDTLYRSIDSDNWKVVFPLTENQINQYSDMSYVKVRFLSQNLTMNAGFPLFTQQMVDMVCYH